jgi:hypothetical protein
MGILDLFRKKTPQQKTVAELARDKRFVQYVENAIIIMTGLENKILGFFESLEKNAKNRKNLALRDAIERHGFHMDLMQGRAWDAEKLAVYANRQAKWAEIKKEADKVLDMLAALRQMLKGKKGSISEEAVLSEMLRAQFDRFTAVASDNIHGLWGDLQKYPELIDKKVLNREFEKLRQGLNSEYDVVNKIIENLLVAERDFA